MPASQIYQVIRVLTNAEVKALPTTPITLVEAVAGAVLYPLFTHARMQWVADYTNIDSQAQMQIRAGVQDTVLPLRQEVLSSVGALLAGGGPDGTHAFFSPFFSINLGVTSSYSNVYDADIVNLPIVIKIDNGAGGNLTGGDAGNSLTVEVVYMVLLISD